MKIRIENSGFRIQALEDRHRAEVLTQSSIPYPLSLRGFTLVELAVVVCIVGVLAATLLTRVWFYQEQAEKAAMEQVAGALQSALTLQHARLMTSGREAEIPALTIENPMNWLAKVPRNYVGEYYDMTPRTIAPGNWAFDLKSRSLAYIMERNEHFVPDKEGKKWVRYRVSLLYEAVPDRSGKRHDELVGVVFDPVEPYRWFE